LPNDRRGGSGSARFAEAGRCRPEGRRSAPAGDLKGPAGAEGIPPFRGQVGLIHFWASWCPYCVKEFKAIEALYQLYKTRGFLPYSINVGDTPVAAEAYIAPLGISYPIPLDGGSSVARLYGITGIPTTLLVGRTGLIRYKILGEINQDGLKKLVSVMLV
jgi:cytochrome c biogenesis protein CcmG, thiol:disulfide interchange protein DsbE